MKKSFIVLALLAGFASANIASASSFVIGDKNLSQVKSSHPIYANDWSKDIAGYIPDADWNRAMADAASRAMSKLPVVAPGTIVIDEMGVPDICPSWYFNGCVDATRTDGYRESMRTLARQLIATGLAPQFPRYAKWVASVK